VELDEFKTGNAISKLAFSMRPPIAAGLHSNAEYAMPPRARRPLQGRLRGSRRIRLGACGTFERHSREFQPHSLRGPAK
jgi:hypothetical protein